MNSTPSGRLTELLLAWSEGREEALEELLPKVQRELQKLARAYMRRERIDHTLQPTALVNECFIRLIDQDRVAWRNRAHFFGIAAQCMRRILIDHGRKRRAVKRGAGNRITFDEALAKPAQEATALAGIAEALDSLSKVDPRAARVVELRVFAGLSIEEVASALDVSNGTVKRDWLAAKLWLRRHLQGKPDA